MASHLWSIFPPCIPEVVWLAPPTGLFEHRRDEGKTEGGDREIRGQDQVD